MKDKIFVDTNILVYSIADDIRKRAIAEDILLQERIVMSPQVISEFIAVSIRKQILDSKKVIEYANKFLKIFHISIITADTVTCAIDIMTKYHFSYWDCLILAAALENECTIVYSEDLQDGQLIEEQIKIINPFK
jgi:predicted nucleic acid-binding protein